MSRLGRTLLSIIAVLVFSSIATSAWGSGSGVGPRRGGGARRASHRQTGKLSFLGADPAEPIVVPSAQAEGLTSDERAMAILEAYGSEFGLNEPGMELELIPDKTLARDRGSVRYQQTYQGIPVLAGGGRGVGSVEARLRRPGRRPAELVWRMDVEGIERLKIRELVLVNAMRGGISL